MRCVSVLVADRHPVVLQGLTNLFAQGVVSKLLRLPRMGRVVLKRRRWVPDIAIFDISMPGLTGLDVVAIANSENLPTRQILFTTSIDDRELVMAAAAGA